MGGVIEKQNIIKKVPKVDVNRTKHAVEKILFDYQQYSLSYDFESVSITSTLEHNATFSNQFHSKIESFIDKKEEIENFLLWVIQCVNKLKKEDKELIIKRYLTRDLEDEPDYVIQEKCGISRTAYYTKKKSALINLAFALKVVVFRE
ncbi:hypothetical protein E2L07_19280 [Halalkalibacterium halodurans]|uniref:ArpU family phage packaging/lysis transcriptional regulator n=1 Tax=Halalkalibacterium halodurans TaxID=86665 RepID=UPI00106788BC|nr:ArpU family phage packaging/lysis transcriptional regulator [Halalkalibacterium halodurans]TES47187.1 hypothetical protein E2L07_19280 [Halalkalibacterium halodurans]